jgi:hypothetical protein
MCLKSAISTKFDFHHLSSLSDSHRSRNISTMSTFEAIIHAPDQTDNEYPPTSSSYLPQHTLDELHQAHKRILPAVRGPIHLIKREPIDDLESKGTVFAIEDLFTLLKTNDQQLRSLGKDPRAIEIMDIICDVSYSVHMHLWSCLPDS